MKKSISILIVLLLVIVVLFSFVGCNAHTDKLHSKIDELQSKLEELEEQIWQRDRRIAQLEKELRAEGPFYTLQCAYDRGWLTQEDLQTMANYHNKSILYPESLSEDITQSIKKDWAKKLNDEKAGSATEVTEEMVYIVKYY